MKPAAAYLRRSTDRQEQSLPDQEKAIRKYAAENDLEIVRFYQDDAISGTSTNGRKGFEQMMADSERAHCSFKYILVYDVSRFSRADNIEAGHFLYLLRKRGIEVVYVAENFPSDHTGDLIRSLKQSIAHEATVDVSRKTFRGLLTSAEQGNWLGGVPPYGYDLQYENSDGVPFMTVRFLNDGKKEIRRADGTLDRVLPRGQRVQISKKDRARLVLSSTDRVELVQRIFEMYVRESLGLKAIAERLNKEGLPSPRDGCWSEKTGRGWGIGTLQSILKNPLCTGLMVWNRRSKGKFHRVEGGQARERAYSEFEKLAVNVKENWIVVPDAHPAIIDRHTFDEAHRLLRERAARHFASGAPRFGRAKNSPYLLTGVMKCARCGHAYQGYSSHSRKHRKSGEKILTRYYACSGYVNKGNSVCKRALVALKPVEEYVLGRISLRVEELLTNGGKKRLRDAIASELRSCGPDPKEEMRDIRARLKGIDESIDRLLDSITPINKEFIDKKLLALGSEKKALEEKLKQLEVKPDDLVNPDQMANDIVQGLVKFRELFEQGTPEEKKELVRAFVEKLELNPETGKGALYIRQFPASIAKTGNASFNMVPGARFEPATFGAPSGDDSPYVMLDAHITAHTAL
jgi:DNA invertase Pin-like site-specific DNA recombinase